MAAHDLIYFSSRRLQWLKGLVRAREYQSPRHICRELNSTVLLSRACEIAPSWPGYHGERVVCLELPAGWRGAGCDLSQGSGCSPGPCTELLVLPQASPALLPLSTALQLAWVWPADMIARSLAKHARQRPWWDTAQAAFSTLRILSFSDFMILFSFRD